MFTLFTTYVISDFFFCKSDLSRFLLRTVFKTVFKYFVFSLYTFKKCHAMVIFLPSPEVLLHRFSSKLLEVLGIIRLKV